MDLSKITPIVLYQLSLLNTEYIDFNNSVICKDGTVNIMLDTRRIPKPNFKVDDKDWILKNLSESNECYIKFDPEQGIAKGLFIEFYAVLHKYEFVYIAVICYMKELNHPEYQKYKCMYDEFNSKVMEWIKSRIRIIFQDTKGNLIDDIIKKDTYFQKREYNHNNVYYIVYQWWKKVLKSSVSFTNVASDENGSVFIALNDD